jgi:hypothetical protein
LPVSTCVTSDWAPYVELGLPSSPLMRYNLTWKWRQLVSGKWRVSGKH